MDDVGTDTIRNTVSRQDLDYGFEVQMNICVREKAVDTKENALTGGSRSFSIKMKAGKVTV